MLHATPDIPLRFPKGCRVTATTEGYRTFGWDEQMGGTVVGYSWRNPWIIAVVRDGTKTRARYHYSYWKRVD